MYRAKIENMKLLFALVTAGLMSAASADVVQYDTYASPTCAADLITAIYALSPNDGTAGDALMKAGRVWKFVRGSVVKVETVETVNGLRDIPILVAKVKIVKSLEPAETGREVWVLSKALGPAAEVTGQPPHR
jgi:hypothetical protein